MEQNKDIESAVAVVLSFANAINDWETRRYHRSRLDHGYEFTAKKDARLAGPLSASELDEEYVVRFRAHCTDRKRTYSGFPHSWSKPPRYDGITEDTVIDATQVKPDRIEVICAGGPFPDTQIKFVVFKKREGWLIDNALSRVGDTGEWERTFL